MVGANLAEVKYPLDEFRTLQDFFGRPLRDGARPIAKCDMVGPYLCAVFLTSPRIVTTMTVCRVWLAGTDGLAFGTGVPCGRPGRHSWRSARRSR